MTAAEKATADAIASEIEGMLDDVYGHVDRLRSMVIDSVEPERTTLSDAALAGIEGVARDLVTTIPWVGGAGFVAALDTVDREHRYWNWWMRSTEGVSRLHPPRNASGSAEYAYESMQWYRDGQDGRASVFGPFVDFAGVNQLVILCAQPVREREVFLGVVGADLVIDRVEIHLVRILRKLDGLAVLVGASGRVVASSLATLAPGERFDPAGWEMTAADEGRADWKLYTRPMVGSSTSQEVH